MFAYDFCGIHQKTKNKSKNNIKHIFSAPVKNKKAFFLKL